MNTLDMFDRTYEFGYDGLSRLTSARYTDAQGGNSYFDTEYAYDLNGNVTSLTRYGLHSRYGGQYSANDLLEYEYRGNQVKRIADSSAGPVYQGAYHFVDGADEEVEYAYDANGNMTMDLNRGIASVSYDTGNRPRSVEFSSGARTDYRYDAAGRKLMVTHSVPAAPPSVDMAGMTTDGEYYGYTDYCGNIIYEDNVLSRINLENGYISLRDGAGTDAENPHYHVFLRDHLGNNRVDLDMTAGGEICQIMHYYPFGLPMNAGYRRDTQRWLFGGKELDRMAGLDQYDFEARMYDPATIRFTRMDDMAEKYQPASPYAYCLNNPLVNIDPTGMKTYLFSTTLPGFFSFLPATHTFIYIDNPKVAKEFKMEKVEDRYFCYGSATDNPFGGQLVRCKFKEDISTIIKAVYGKELDKRTTSLTVIYPPEGMSEDDFDRKVINTASEFGNDPDITYNINPLKETEGNCNSSSSTILIKAGAPTETLEYARSQFDGLDWGFSTEKTKPWTAEEQAEASKKKNEKKY